MRGGNGVPLGFMMQSAGHSFSFSVKVKYSNPKGYLGGYRKTAGETHCVSGIPCLLLRFGLRAWYLSHMAGRSGSGQRAH
eukprot:3889502-Amphidinium_carterae.1